MARAFSILTIAIAIAVVPLRANAQTSTTQQPPEQRAGQQQGQHPPQQGQKTTEPTRPVLEDPSNTDREALKERARKMMERLFDPPKGLFVRYGGLPQGSGFTLGPAYRLPIGKALFTASGAASIRSYWEVDANVAMPHLRNNHYFVTVGGRRRYLPQEDFFGLGTNTTEDMRTSYTLKENVFYVDAGVKPTKSVTLGATTEYRMPRVSHGRDRRYPSIEDLFSSDTVPTLATDANFVRVGARVMFDYRNEATDSTDAGRYLIAVDRYMDRSIGRYTFSQWTTEIREFLPVADGHVLAFRGFATGVNPAVGQQVPFFYQPTLGGPNGMRGYPSYRFRDHNVLLLQGEYRFDLHKHLVGAVFYDTGDVAPKLGGLRLSEFKQDVGVGLRVRYNSRVVVRIDVAHAIGGGMMYMMKFSDVF